MEYKHLEKLDKKVSMLAVGGMRFPTIDSKIDFDKSAEILDYAIKNGVNYLDTAYFYHDGESEIFFGKAIKKYNREDFFIADKLPIWCCDTPEDMQKLFDTQLKRLDVEYIDFYLLHALDKNNFKKCKDFKAYEFVKEMQKQGKIRHIGFSFHDTPEVLEEICSTYEWDFAQIQLNYLDVTLQRAMEQYDILVNHNIPCFVMEPVRGGALADFGQEVNNVFKQVEPECSIASWAIRFVASLDNVYAVLSGMTTIEQVIDNVKTLSPLKKLSSSDHNTIDTALELYNKLNSIPCTGCRYCMDCPFGVDIPNTFKIYNDYKTTRADWAFDDAVKQNKETMPNNCVNCKKCLEHCPQHIDIPQELSKINQMIIERNII